MLLAVDIGNTDTVFGLFEETSLNNTFRVKSRRDMTANEASGAIGAIFQNWGVDAASISKSVVGSVVPTLTKVYIDTLRHTLGHEPIDVTARIKLPVTIDIDKPDEVGADRIANAAAAFEKHSGPVIVVDFGTATTFDVVNERGAYIGGVITPGPATSMAELARRASKLFEIKIEPPDRVVGRSTEGALKSGLFFGTVGQVDYIVEQIIAETGFENCTVVATGGLASGIEKHSRLITLVDPDLTLTGLRLIADLN